MNKKMDFAAIAEREQGLKRQLTPAQMSMIAIGGAIGTGLFMGSSYAIGFAGPGVLISYVIGAVIALLLMGCLAEMTIAHPTSGSFGAYAEFYISPLAGFLVRYSYWAAIVLAIGTEVTAIALYMKFWFPAVAGWVWILLFSGLLISTNAISVKTFGHFEYVFSAIKILAIVAFILLAGWLVFAGGNPSYGFHHYVEHGGFTPNGLKGVWIGLIIAIFSYFSIEMIAVAAGEAEQPEIAVRKAFRVTMVRLLVFYLLTLMLILAMMPWQEIAKGGDSPFVSVMQQIGIPGATGVFNFVILIAALSAMNSQLYTTTRMMFSLSRAGHAPKAMGRVSRSGVPLNALALSCCGVVLAMLVSLLWPEKSFMLMMAISIFGALFAWLMIFLTHYRFRRHHQKNQLPLKFRMWGFPWTSISGFVLILGVLLATAFTADFRMTLVFGLPFLAFLAIAYRLLIHPKRAQVSSQALQHDSI